MVAVAEFLVLARAVFHQLTAIERLGVHCHERFHAVATVNVEHLSHRAESVRGIDVATEFLVVVESPAEFVILACLPVIIPELREFVAIGTHRVDDFAEKPLLSHVERVEFEEIVAAILKNHAVQTLLFREVDELPDFVHVHRRRHFNRHVLTAQQRLFRHEEVVNPVGGDINHVDVVALAKFLVAVFARIDVGRRHRSLFQILLTAFGAFFHIVAESHDLNARNVRPTLHCARSAHTQTDECHAHHVHFRRDESEGGFLSGRHRRNFRHDGAVFHGVRPVELTGFGLLRPHCYRQHQCCKQNRKKYVSFHHVMFLIV